MVYPINTKDNVVEYDKSSKHNKYKNKNKLGKEFKLVAKEITFKKSSFKGICFNCQRTRHRFPNYNFIRRKRYHDDNIVDDIVQDV